MQQPTYKICSYSLGNGTNGQVYKIKKIHPPHSVLIAKIFRKDRSEIFEREKRMLLRISNANDDNINDYLLHIRDANATLDISEEFREGSELLTFDFFMHGNIIDYVSLKNKGRPLCELYAKLICYKLLIGLKKCHENRVSHNKLEIRNIMFDENFNPIIIHFGEAKISDNHKKDFIGLGKVLAELLTSRQIISCKLDKNTNKYMLRFYPRLNSATKDNFCEESTFWKLLEETSSIKLSKEFIDFFHKLISPDDIVNVDDLLNSEWLKEVIIEQQEIEKILKDEFYNNYYMLKESQELFNNYNHQINLASIIDNDEMGEAFSQNNIIGEFVTKINKLDEKR
jgi:serine/threonine protein kinase